MAPRFGHIFKPISERLEAMSIPEPNSGCFIWMGAENGRGYGRVSIGQRQFYAHRVSYELKHGPIPPRLQIDHKCRNTFCINPDHLEPVTNQENTSRGLVSALRPERTRCFRGHDLADTGYIDTQNNRQCRACLKIRQTKYRSRNR
jgi:HNH endonuclease